MLRARRAKLGLKIAINLARESTPRETHGMNDVGAAVSIYAAMHRHAASAPVLALACRALVCLHTDLWHEAMRGVWHESAGRAVSLHGERQRALELVEQARARWPRERRLQKYAARLLAGLEPQEPEPEPEPEPG